MRFLFVASLLAACSGDGTSPPPALGPLAGSVAPHPGFAYPDNFIDLVAHSGWIFQATVTELHAATEPTPPPWADPEHQWDLARMVVVRIDQVAVQPLQDPLPPGTQDTIILLAPPGFDVGYSGYFFVTPYEAGNSWVFIEQGHLDANFVPFGTLSHKVHEVQLYLSERALYDRMVGANRVILGAVQSTQRLPGPISDNLPEWWEAQVAVDGTLDGPPPTVTPYYTVRFEGSQNECCIHMPKLHVGDQSILLLYPDTVTGQGGDAFLVMDPLDVQRAQDLDRLQALLGAAPQPPPLDQP